MTDGGSPHPSTWRDRARAFATETIRPIAAQIDTEDRLPSEVRTKLAEQGFLGLGVPSDWGGSGGATIDLAAVLEELAHASAAVATLVSVQLSVVEAPILRWGTDDQKLHFLRPLAEGRHLGAFALTEPGAGSDAASISTRYVRDGDEFVLNGAKTFITNAITADTVLLFAGRQGAAGPRRISAFLLSRGTDGFSRGTAFDKLGIRGSETSELILHDVRIPSGQLLGPEGEGLRVALEALTGGRVGIASCALGVAQAAFDRLRELSQAQPNDAAQSRIGRSYVELLAARSLVERAARLKDSGSPFVPEASAAKLAATSAALRISQRALDAEGGEGRRADSPAGRLWRDARVFPIVEGTSEIQEWILGRSLLPSSDDG